MRRTMTTLLALCGLATGLTACAPAYDGFDCRMVNQTPTAALCTDQRIEVGRGEALVVRISPQSDSRSDYEDPEVELRSADPQMLDIRPGLGSDFTLIGLTVGDATAEVWVDGELVDEVPTRILTTEPSAGRD